MVEEFEEKGGVAAGFSVLRGLTNADIDKAIRNTGSITYQTRVSTRG